MALLNALTPYLNARAASETRWLRLSIFLSFNLRCHGEFPRHLQASALIAWLEYANAQAAPPSLSAVGSEPDITPAPELVRFVPQAEIPGSPIPPDKQITAALAALLGKR
jgi:hypothetical protein